LIRYKLSEKTERLPVDQFPKIIVMKNHSAWDRSKSTSF
jgi:hypothetical protein